jgi:hypothetical protein
MGNWAAHGDAAVSEVAQENSPGTRPDDNVATLATIAIQGRAAVEYQHCTIGPHQSGADRAVAN